MSTEKEKLLHEIEYLEARLLVAEDDAEKLHHALREKSDELSSVRSELLDAGHRHLRARHHKEPEASPGGMDFRLAKRTILVITNRLPAYDRSSRERSLHAYLRLFLAMGYDVALLAEDFTAAEPYMSGLLDMGVKALAGQRFEQGWHSWVEQNAAHICTVLVTNMEAARRFMRFIKKHVDVPALYFAEEQDEKQGGQTVEAQAIESAMERIMLHDADAVLLFGEGQEKAYPAKTARIPLYFYYDIPARKTGFEQTNGLLFVGSFLRGRNEEGVRWFVKEVLPLVRQALPGVKLTAVGEGAPASLFVEEGVVAAGHVPDASLDRFYETSRVAVVPILTGGGVTGKTVEAMAHGLPFVSTAAGLAGLPAAGQVAQPADTVEAFAAQVVQKYLDKAEWEKTSDAYRKYLREFASFKEAERIWKKILANAAER